MVMVALVDLSKDSNQNQGDGVNTLQNFGTRQF